MGTPGNKTSWRPNPKKRQYGRIGNYDRKPQLFFSEETRADLYSNSRTGFVETVLKNYKKKATKPEDVVEEARQYFKYRHEQNPDPKSHWLNSASSALTRTKAKLKQLLLAPYAFRRELALTPRELEFLDKFNHSRLEQKIHQNKEISLYTLTEKLYDLMLSEDPAKVALGVAGLTGRRQTEITHSAEFHDPMYPIKHRYPSFWAHVTGFSKRKVHDKYAVRSRELPLLAPRDMIQAAVKFIREEWPSDSTAQASELYGYRLAAATHEHLVPLGVTRMHDLRKTFATTAHQLFNENELALPGFASYVLGHKRALSNRIMTYLIIRTTSCPTLDCIFGMCGSKLSSDKPEYNERLCIDEGSLVESMEKMTFRNEQTTGGEEESKDDREDKLKTVFASLSVT
jgi:hypothetical protein